MKMTKRFLACLLAGLTIFTSSAAKAQDFISVYEAVSIAEKSLPEASNIVTYRPWALEAQLLPEGANPVWIINMVGSSSYRYTIGIFALTGQVVNIVNHGRYQGFRPLINLGQAGELATYVVPGLVTNISLGTFLMTDAWAVAIDTRLLGVFVVYINAQTGVVLGVKHL